MTTRPETSSGRKCRHPTLPVSMRPRGLCTASWRKTPILDFCALTFTTRWSPHPEAWWSWENMSSLRLTGQWLLQSPMWICQRHERCQKWRIIFFIFPLLLKMEQDVGWMYSHVGIAGGYAFYLAVCWAPYKGLKYIMAKLCESDVCMCFAQSWLSYHTAEFAEWLWAPGTFVCKILGEL